MNRFVFCVIGIIVTCQMTMADELQIFEVHPNEVIPANDTSEFDMFVKPDANCPIIQDIEVGLMIPHTWQGDLKITLIHTPTETSAVLFDRPGSPQQSFGFSADNYGNTQTGELFFLDDEAMEIYDAAPFGNVDFPGIPNVTGSWLPEESLSVFRGIDASGVWRLRIEDHGGGDIGTLNTWALHITSTPVPIPSPSTVYFFVGLVCWLQSRRNESRN